MSLQVEKMEKNMAKLTIEVAAEDLEKAMQNAYQKAKGRISIPGFRKGKAPRKMIEQMYGKGVFLEDAVNALILRFLLLFRHFQAVKSGKVRSLQLFPDHGWWLYFHLLPHCLRWSWHRLLQ